MFYGAGWDVPRYIAVPFCACGLFFVGRIGFDALWGGMYRGTLRYLFVRATYFSGLAPPRPAPLLRQNHRQTEIGVNLGGAREDFFLYGCLTPTGDRDNRGTI